MTGGSGEHEMEMRASALLTMLLVVEKLHGADVAARSIEAMPAALSDTVRAKRLLPSTWVKITAYAALLRGFGLDDATMQKLGNASADHDVNTMYRVVFKFLSPETLARQTPKFFGIYYRGAHTIRVVESARDFCRVEYRDCHGFDHYIWQDYVAGSETILQICGAKNVRTEIESGGTGSSMVASARWD